MRYKREFTEENFEELMGLPYGRMVKAAAILQLIEEEGVMYLTFEVEDITEGVNGSEFLKSRKVRDYSFPLSEF